MQSNYDSNIEHTSLPDLEPPAGTDGKPKQEEPAETGEEPKDTDKAAYAGFWVRFFAYLIDSVIVGFGLLAVRLFMSGVTAAVSGTALDGNLIFHYTLTDIVLYLAQAAYFVLFTYYTGCTPGKRALNLRVVCADETEKLSLWDVVYRETVGRFLCTVTIGIGYLFAAVDAEKRGLHDMLCDTRVIYARTLKVYPIYYGWNGKKVRGGNETMQKTDPAVKTASPTVQTMAAQDVYANAAAKGEKAMQKGDFGGYRIVRPEDKTDEIGKMD